MITFIILGTFLVLAFRIVWNLYLKPKKTCLFYKNQGFDMNFVFGDGFNNIEQSNFVKHGDFAYREKYELSKTPEKRGFGGNLGGYTTIAIFDPILLKEFTNLQEKYYRKPSIYDVIRIGGETGLVFAEGSQWKKHRKIISTAFHFELLKNMIPSMVDVTLDHFKELKNQNEMVARNTFESIAGQVVGKLFFGANYSKYRVNGEPLNIALKEIIKEAFLVTYSLPNLLFGVKLIKSKILPRHKKLLDKAKAFLDFCSNIVEERIKYVKENRNKLQNTSLVDNMIIQALDNPEEGLETKEIVDEFAVFVVAGMDTTGHTLSMCAYYYAQHPEVHDKIKEEVNKYLQDPNNVSYDDINKMVYIQAFLNEVLRMNSPSFRGFLRESLEDHMLGDVKIQKGTLISPAWFPNNYNENYHQKPFQFLPERWIENDSKSRQMSNKDPYIFTPFLVGPRNCIGKNLATIEIKLVFAMFVKYFDFSVADNFKLRMAVKFLYEPDDDITLKIKSK